MTDKPKLPPEVEIHQKLANEIVAQVGPLMLRYPPHAIGAALATLTAQWLAGYRGARGQQGAAASATKLRAIMFANLVRSVVGELPEIMQEVDAADFIDALIALDLTAAAPEIGAPTIGVF
jgi:hypothetical protein